MSEQPKAEWWKAGLAGGVIFGLLGPLIVVTLNLIRADVEGFHSRLTDVPYIWLPAVVLLGLPAFVLGCGCGTLVKALSLKCSTMKIAVMPTAALGFALGAVPFGVLDLVDRNGAPGVVWANTACGVAGIMCALLVLLLLDRRGLLRFRARGSELPPLV